MSRRKEYRLATDDERIILNRQNLCWLVKEWSGKAHACPNPRQEGRGTCEHHAWWEGHGEEPLDEPEVAASASTPGLESGNEPICDRCEKRGSECGCEPAGDFTSGRRG